MLFKVVVLCCLWAVANADHRILDWRSPLPTVQNRGTRVVGGKNANVGEFPHQVSLQRMLLGVMTHFCGGSIISAQWILTAGHCVFQIDSAIIVKAGKHNIKIKEDSEQSIAVKAIFIHEDYVGEVAPFDIALLKLKIPLKFNARVAPIRLPREAGAEPMGYVTVSGWGWTSKTLEPIKPAILQKVKIPILNRKTCNSTLALLSASSKLHVTNICTGPLVGGLGSCKGDSGGPLIAKTEHGDNELVGIVSWGFVPCGTRDTPSIYVKVSDFLVWISRVILNND